MMATTATTSNVIHAKLLELPRTNRHSWISFSANNQHRVSATSAEGPSCIFVGPLETANKETLEALYCQVTTISKLTVNFVHFLLSISNDFNMITGSLLFATGTGCLL
jgi:hypothetical protein